MLQSCCGGGNYPDTDFIALLIEVTLYPKPLSGVLISEMQGQLVSRMIEKISLMTGSLDFYNWPFSHYV